jgi:hypothetical protein
LSSAALSIAIEETIRSAPVPSELSVATVQVGSAALAGSAGMASVTASTLADGVISTMSLGKIKLAMVIVAAIGLFGTGGGLFLRRGEAGSDPPAAKSQQTQSSTPAPAHKADSGVPAAKPALAYELERRVEPDLEIRDLLTRTIKFEGIDDPQVTLKEAIDQISARYNLQIDVNERAFSGPAADDMLNKFKIIQQRPLAPTNVPLSVVLSKLLGRLPASLEATFLIRDNRIEITSAEALRQELGLAPNAPIPPLVYEHFKDTPLLEALDRIAKSSGLSVVVDSGAAQQVNEARFNAWLRNVPAETAVRVIAAGRDLPVVRMGNVLYVAIDDSQAESLERVWRALHDPTAPPAYERAKK